MTAVKLTNCLTSSVGLCVNFFFNLFQLTILPVWIKIDETLGMIGNSAIFVCVHATRATPIYL